MLRCASPTLLVTGLLLMACGSDAPPSGDADGEDGTAGADITTVVEVASSVDSDASPPTDTPTETLDDTPTVPSVHDLWAEANVTNPMAAWVFIETDEAVSVRVGAWRGDTLDWESIEGAPATQHRVAVLGMRQSTDYDLVVTLVDDGEVVSDTATVAFTTGSLALTLPPITVSVYDPERAQGGVTFFGLQMRTTGDEEVDSTWPLYLAVDMLGLPVWSYQDTSLDHDLVVRRVTRTSDGNLVLLLKEGVRIVTPAGDVVQQWFADGALGRSYHHDAVLLESGNLLALAFETRDVDVPSLGGVVEVRGDTLFEVEPEGQVVWEWTTFDHLDPIVLPGPLSSEPNPKGGYHDWTHANALVHEEATDTVLVSLRHQNQVIRIDRGSGDVVDRIGAGGDHALLEGEWFYSQHAPEIGADGSLLVYDNGNERTEGFGGAVLPKPDRYSRAVRFDVDSAAKTASQVWSYQVPEFTAFIGGVEGLANGNVLVCAGGVRGTASSGLARLHEVTSGAPAELVWALEVEGFVYRATRLSGLSH